MAFKMKGINFGKGTGSANGFSYTPQSVRYKEDPDYNPDFKYDRLGRVISDSEKAAQIGSEINRDVSGVNPESQKNVFGSITTSVATGKDKSDKYANYSEDQHAKMLEQSIKRWKKAEEKYGVGNVDRGNMTDRHFDYLVNYGGPESTGGSWAQQRMIDSAYGLVDNESHIKEDKRMYKEGEWTSEKSPSIKKIQKNLANNYMNIMNDASTADFIPGYSDSSTEVNKKQAMDLAKNLAPTENLTRFAPPIRDNQSILTAEQEEAEAAEVDKQTEKDVERLDRTQPVKEKPIEEEVVDKKPAEEEVATKPDFSGPNPYEYGTDEHHQWKKDRRSHKLGLTKRIFNIYDNK